jgi:ankyrin repeat protein
MNEERNNKFIYAIISGDIEKVKDFIEAGIDVNKYDSSKRLPIFIASLHGYTDIVKELIKAGSDVNKGSNSEWKPIYIASANGYHDIVRILIAAGANVNIITPAIGAPLHIASRRGHIYVVRELIDAKADLNIKDVYSKSTPLILAASQGQGDVVRALIEAGADINIKNKDGNTALDLARNNEIKDILMAVTHKKNLLGVQEVVNSRNLPLDVGSIMASMLTGKTGKGSALRTQINETNQKLGVSLAPRSWGGSRKTKKYRKKRTVKRARKN